MIIINNMIIYQAWNIQVIDFYYFREIFKLTITNNFYFNLIESLQIDVSQLKISDAGKS